MIAIPMLALAAFSAGAAGVVSPAGGEAGACAAARDRDLRALAVEAIAIANGLDVDAALADAPEYELAETRDALLAEIARERREVEDRHRRCLAGP